MQPIYQKSSSDFSFNFHGTHNTHDKFSGFYQIDLNPMADGLRNSVFKPFDDLLMEVRSGRWIRRPNGLAKRVVGKALDIAMAVAENVAARALLVFEGVVGGDGLIIADSHDGSKLIGKILRVFPNKAAVQPQIELSISAFVDKA